MNPRHNGSNDAATVGEDASPLSALGICLREAREQRGLSSTALAAQLRMGEEQLLALESGDRDRLPELVFVIAQARRIATALGVDINVLVEPLKQESAKLKPAPAPLSSTPANNRERTRAQLTARSYTEVASSRHGSGGRHAASVIGSLALLAGLLAAGVWGWQRAPKLVMQRLPKASKPVNAPPPAAQKPKPAPVATRPKLSTPASDLTVNATQPSWLAVRTANGKVLFEGTFQGSRQFPLAGGLELLAGRPDLVQVSQGDQPAKPLGRIDQIRWVAFKPQPR